MNEFKIFSNNVPLQKGKLIRKKIQTRYLTSGVSQITAQFKNLKAVAVIKVARVVPHHHLRVKIALAAVIARKVKKNLKQKANNKIMLKKLLIYRKLNQRILMTQPLSQR